MLNNVLINIGNNIDQESGIDRLEIDSFKDKNILELQSLKLIAAKCLNIRYLTVANLQNTSDSNRRKILFFVRRIIISSNDLLELHIINMQEIKKLRAN